MARAANGRRPKTRTGLHLQPTACGTLPLRHSHLDHDARARPCPGGRMGEGGVAMRTGQPGAPNIFNLFALPGVRGRCPEWTGSLDGWSGGGWKRQGANSTRAGARGRNEWTALKMLAKVPCLACLACLWLGCAWDWKMEMPECASVLIKGRNPLGVLPSRPRPLCSWFRVVPLSSGFSPPPQLVHDCAPNRMAGSDCFP